jgi:hypothetical protein
MKEELEYNRSLENRMDGWMDGISVRVREMEETGTGSRRSPVPIHIIPTAKRKD